MIHKSGYKFVKGNGVMNYIMIKYKPVNEKYLDICQTALNNIHD